MRFDVLGVLRVRRDGRELTLGPRQQRLILALLLVRAGQPVGVSEFVDLLWGEEAPQGALNVVHRNIGAVRRLLEPGLPPRADGRWLIRQAGTYRLLVDHHNLDLLQARRSAEQAQHAGRRGDHDSALAAYLQALELWRGPCAGGADLLTRPHPAFDAVDQEHAAIARRVAEEALRCGTAGRVLPAVRRAGDLHPLDETLRARLLLLLSADGRQAEAVAAYHDIRQRLADELGIDPGEELRAAYRAVIQPRTAKPEPGDGAGPDGGPDSHLSVRPAQLPPDMPHFSGRDDVLRRLHGLLAEHDSGPSRVAILAVDGIPGIGKTALVTHLAHQLAGRYPEGQLYADLRGFDAAGAVLDPAEALHGFLHGLGVAPSHIPHSLNARSGLYRSVLAGRRILVVLDNAHDVEQVRPLLPGSTGCLVLVTSRNRLTGLATAHGAHLITLDVPGLAEARDGLTARLGAARAQAEPGALDDIIERCGRLPLALSIVAARAAAHPRHPLSAIAAELDQAQGGLDGFSSDDLSNDLRAIFSWSYHRLSPHAAQAFRLLPVHPGPGLTLAAFASLTGCSLPQARALTGELLRTRLLTEYTPGRYRTHDLIHAYATELSRALDDEAHRERALHRLLHHYRHTAHRAEVLLEITMALEPPEAPPGTMVSHLTTVPQAVAWFSAERHLIKAMAQQAIDAGHVELGWQLAITLQIYFQREGRWLEWAETMGAALRGVVAAGDEAGQAYLLRSLAGARHYSGQTEHARGLLLQALQRFRRLGRVLEQARVLMNLGRVDYETGNYARCIEYYQKTQQLLGPLGDAGLRANALMGMADGMIRLGRHADSAPLIHEAARLRREAGQVDHLALCHESLAGVYRAQGDYATALEYGRLALDLHRRGHWPTNLLECCIEIGHTALAAGDLLTARAACDEALATFNELPSPRSPDVEKRLAHLRRIISQHQHPMLPVGDPTVSVPSAQR